MSDKLFINDFREGKEINETFYVEEKNRKETREGKPFLDLLLRDKTGCIPSVMWDGVDKAFITFSRGDFIRATGLVKSYKDKLQLSVNRIEKVEAGEINRLDFIDSLPPEQIETYSTELLKYVEEIQDPFIKKLLDSFFQDFHFYPQYFECPAAKNVHHDKLGGLLKHTVYMARVAKRLTSVYKNLNNDLLMAGVILHDIGKVRELRSDVSIDYTEEGQLIGHCIIGIKLMRERIAGIPDFPENLAFLLEHIFLSHHGESEFGAVKKPCFKEAMLVHLIDLIDSKMEIMDKALRETGEGGLWSDKCWALDNLRLMRIDRFLSNSENTE